MTKDVRIWHKRGRVGLHRQQVKCCNQVWNLLGTNTEICNEWRCDVMERVLFYVTTLAVTL